MLCKPTINGEFFVIIVTIPDIRIARKVKSAVVQYEVIINIQPEITLHLLNEFDLQGEICNPSVA